MAIHSVAIMALIKKLEDICPSTVQTWFADDDAAGDRLVKLRRYWDELSRLGPSHGYFSNS